MTNTGDLIAYTALAKGVPMVSASGREFGTVEHVLQVPEEDLFDGIVVATHDGLRFVERDQVDQITTTRVQCTISDDAVDNLPAPNGTPTYEADPLADAGQSLHDRFGRMFGRAHWTRTD